MTSVVASAKLAAPAGADLTPTTTELPLGHRRPDPAALLKGTGVGLDVPAAYCEQRQLVLLAGEERGRIQGVSVADRTAIAG